MAEMSQPLVLHITAGVAALVGLSLPVAAWTPPPRRSSLARRSRLSPLDLARQIDKHRRAYQEGINAPFAEADSGRRMKNPDGSGQLDRAALEAANAAIEAIRSHRPFEEIVRRLGVVAHYVA